jgi:hypothetical protein
MADERDQERRFRAAAASARATAARAAAKARGRAQFEAMIERHAREIPAAKERLDAVRRRFEEMMKSADARRGYGPPEWPPRKSPPGKKRRRDDDDDGSAALPVEPKPSPKPLAGAAEAPIE